MVKILGVLAVTGGLAGSQTLLAGEQVDYAKALAGTSIVEMPAKAAGLVSKADVQGRKNVTIAVVKAAVRLNPTAAVAVVGAVSKSNPEMAPIAAVTAASAQRKQLAAITKAAAAAAPSQAAAIVAALIKEFPSSYPLIAISASEGVPQAGKEILAVVADFVPGLQASIDSAIASYPSSAGQPQAVFAPALQNSRPLAAAPVLPVSAILAQALNQTPGVTIAARPVPTGPQNSHASDPSGTPAGGPTLGPPFTPIVGPVTTIGPGQTVPQSPGGRNYASP